MTSLIVISSKKAAKFKEHILERNVYLYEQLEVQSLSVQREPVKLVTSLSWDIFAMSLISHFCDELELLWLLLPPRQNAKKWNSTEGMNE